MGEQNQRQTTKRTEGVFLYDALMNDTYVLEESQKPAFAKQYQGQQPSCVMLYAEQSRM